MIEIQPATSDHLPDVLEWLKAEEEDSGTGFYCNRNVIAKSFARGEGLCAFSEGRIVGFAIFQMFTDSGDVHIVEVKPGARGQGLGSRLLLASIETLRNAGAKYIDVECTSEEGEMLCKRRGFEDYMDPRNQRNEWDNPTLRLYLSDWRPPAPHPWA
ncbi:GNAT family N-acetyltransferase [Rubrivivax gelatinosus]|uniref:Putative N-acetyltransferase n=1 Tax=Rubrivivax gelatinosus (strain NBRC 100245 / IL144) TaxID=983917 RepID=I0HW27_RUBGI|nr:GNAT family N-acetyltransferase [Rubrivivax gelatinosus]BAL97214.1 putative N-acetyltransferase [Rubrivivax gelatinosus IL144]